ncbi:MAG: NAD+ synthase [bacterium]
MRIALAQINTIIGDFEHNINLILERARQAKILGADLCCFPEQCIPGYPAHDLIERPYFLQQNLQALHQIAKALPDIPVVVGFAEPHSENVGKGVYNSAALIEKGTIKSVHRKTLLPTYDVFDESRYFDPAPNVKAVEIRGLRLGITICEDIWNDPEFWSHRLYDRDPIGELMAQGIDLLINIAASPFTMEKRTLRFEMLQSAAKDYKIPVLFVNSVGGNDELVFDGASLGFDARGNLIAQGYEFEEDLILIDTQTMKGDIHPRLEHPEEAALKALILGTRDYARKCGFSNAILGLSGGIDSALVLWIGAEALGKDHIEAVIMPSVYTPQNSIEDAKTLAHHLGVKYRIIPITELFQTYLKVLEPHFLNLPPDTTEENIQARIRGNILMALSNKFGHLVLSTGNKSEIATGYCTLYGDLAGGLAILSDVPKTLVYTLSRFINRFQEIIPSSILNKRPSAELKPDQFDQQTLPPYDLLDAIIEKHIVERRDGPELRESGIDKEIVSQVLTMVRRSEYKRRQSPPGIKLTSKAFGYGRRIPLSHHWRAEE